MNKTKFLFLTLFLFLGFLSQNIHADNFSVSLHVTEGEKSKDSWSSETSISIIGSSISYFKSYSGSMHHDHKSVDKNCSLTNEQVSDLQKLIKDGNLLVSSTIEEQESKYRSIERFVNIAADIILEERVSKIRVNGSVNSVEDKDLYISCYKVINLIEKYVEECK